MSFFSFLSKIQRERFLGHLRQKTENTIVILIYLLQTHMYQGFEACFYEPW
jgi:hypothetical protein